jgi:glucose/arabinose dehydrogenase
VTVPTRRPWWRRWEPQRLPLAGPLAFLAAAVAVAAVVLSGCDTGRPAASGPATNRGPRAAAPSPATVAAGDCTPERTPRAEPPDPGDAPRVSLPAGSVRTIATGLCIPWGLAFLPDGTALVTERGDRATARILSVTPAGEVTEVQRVDGVRATGEGGLLGIAVSPHYARDRWVYVFYSTQSDNRIARLHLGQPPQPILTGIPVGDFHAGGRIAFGPDGMLYATTGETYETREIAQDRGNLGGKILRVTPDGRRAPGNPFPGSPVYSLGHRNPQGLAWDSRGRLYEAELGEGRCDELNLIRPGRNYGWPIEEGPGNDPRFVDPITAWCPTGTASPSGIAILGDHVYVACLRGQRLYRVGLDGKGVQALLVGEYGRLRTVAVAPDRSLWLLTTNRDGRSEPKSDQDDRILRLTP